MSDVMVLLVIGVLIGYILATLNILPFVLGMFAFAIVCHASPEVHDFLTGRMATVVTWLRASYRKVNDHGGPPPA